LYIDATLPCLTRHIGDIRTPVSTQLPAQLGNLDLQLREFIPECLNSLAVLLVGLVETLLNPHLVFLLSETGRPFTPEGFARWFRQQCRRIGLTGSPHGLRKASCRRMAEAGCSAHEIASVSGHMSLKEVQRYCDAADQARMAQRAAERVKAARGEARTRTV
jgi:integrase